ncbi:MAG: hypothetical protein H6633_30625 [Anaerolineales bacterium]|nr:hypothetical protein [Anaerolineales bacterium]
MKNGSIRPVLTDSWCRWRQTGERMIGGGLSLEPNRRCRSGIALDSLLESDPIIALDRV